LQVWAFAAGSGCDALGALDDADLALLLARRTNARMPPYLGLRLPERRPAPALTGTLAARASGSGGGLWAAAAAASGDDDAAAALQHPFAVARLADGRLLLAVAHSLFPDACPYAPHADARLNAAAALPLLCGPPLAVPPLVDADSFSDSPRAFMLFLAALEAALQERPRGSAESGRCDDAPFEAADDEEVVAEASRNTDEASGDGTSRGGMSSIGRGNGAGSTAAPSSPPLPNAPPPPPLPLASELVRTSSAPLASPGSRGGSGEAHVARLAAALRELSVREADQGAALAEAVARVAALQTAAAEAKDAVQTSNRRAAAAQTDAAAWEQKHNEGLAAVRAAEARVQAMRETAASVEKGFLKTLEDARSEAENCNKKVAKAEQRATDRVGKVTRETTKGSSWVSNLTLPLSFFCLACIPCLPVAPLGNTCGVQAESRVSALKEQLRSALKDRDSALTATKKAERRVAGLGAEKSALAARVERLTAAVREQAKFLSELQADADDASDDLAPGVAEYRAKRLELLGAAAASCATPDHGAARAAPASAAPAPPSPGSGYSGGSRGGDFGGLASPARPVAGTPNEKAASPPSPSPSPSSRSNSSSSKSSS
jgi:hypothetical protein